MRHCSPLDPSAVDALVLRLPLPPAPRVLDLACGKAELLLRLAELRGASGVGVDLSSLFLGEARAAIAAREATAEISLIEADAATFGQPGDDYDVVMSIGAREIHGTLEEALDHLAARARPGGLVVLGEGYWKRPPSAEYLDAFGADASYLRDHDATLAAGSAVGLQPLESLVSSEADWDRYEDTWAANGEAWAAAHPDHPDTEPLLEWIRGGRDRYRAKGGRETLGFALFLYRKPPG